MGDVFWSLHVPFAAVLVRSLGLRRAVETGTYHGVGAVALLGLCDEVWTVEHDPLLHQVAVENFGHLGNLHLTLGHSPDVLKRILPELGGPALVVLDAHWFRSSDRAPFGGGSQCPLMGELQTIRECLRDPAACAFMIDDANMFVGGLRPPFRTSDFPRITDVIEVLRSLAPTSEILVADDVIVAAPLHGISALKSYLESRDRTGEEL